MAETQPDSRSSGGAIPAWFDDPEAHEQGWVVTFDHPIWGELHNPADSSSCPKHRAIAVGLPACSRPRCLVTSPEAEQGPRHSCTNDAADEVRDDIGRLERSAGGSRFLK